MFPVSVQIDWGGLAHGLELAKPVRLIGGYDFGAGSSAHDEGRIQSAWAIDRASHKATAIIIGWRRQPGVRPDWQEFYVYGAAWKTLPAPLAEWGKARGMKPSNTFIHLEPTAKKLSNIAALKAGVRTLLKKRSAQY